MKNPSWPDSTANLTFSRVAAWAAANKFGEVLVVNLFARRATDASLLNNMSFEDAVGPGNDDAIRYVCLVADTLVVAWGGNNRIRRSIYERRVAEVLALIDGVEVRTVGDVIASGHPRHPSGRGEMGWSRAMTLRPWRWRQ